jgi:hypothetical protein
MDIQKNQLVPSIEDNGTVSVDDGVLARGLMELGIAARWDFIDRLLGSITEGDIQEMGDKRGQVARYLSTMAGRIGSYCMEGDVLKDGEDREYHYEPW